MRGRRKGRASGSKSSAAAGSMGTQTRPVFGCTQKGALSRWFMCFETSTSRRGKLCANTMSVCVARAESEEHGAAVPAGGTRQRGEHQLAVQSGGAAPARGALNLSLHQRPASSSLLLARRREALAGLQRRG